jgi:hypothetical protein
MNINIDFDTIRKSVKEKGLIDPKIADTMSLNEMIEHLLRYIVLGEIWIPGGKS